MKKLTVSIGIPAYNEEGNIRHLIEALLAQNQKDFDLKEIIVVSDGSTDNTVSSALSTNDPKVRMIAGKSRLGQQVRQNQILKMFTADILVIIEADVLPFGEDTVRQLVAPFAQNLSKKIGMAIGGALPLPPQNFFEKILFWGTILKKGVFKEWRKGDNVYAAGGHSMKAISRDFAKVLIWPQDVPEDAYAYLKLRQLGLKLAVRPKAIALMRNVTSFSDRVRQVKKFVSGKKSLALHFPPETIKNEYDIPKKLILKHIFFGLIKKPLWTILFLGEIVINRIFAVRNDRFSALHEIYYSSKNLNETIAKSPKGQLEVVFLDFDDIQNPILGAGQARATFEVGRRLASRGHLITVISSKYPGYRDRIESGIQYRHIGLGSQNIRLNNIFYILMLPFFVSKIKSDIIVECFTAPISTLFTPLWTKVPVVAQPTSFEAERFSKIYHLPFHMIEGFGLRFYRYFLPYTSYLEEKMKKINPKVVSKTVPEGVGEEYFKIKRTKPQFILFLGRLDVSQKGIDLLLGAFAKIKDKIPYLLVIAGKGPDEKKVKKLISSLGLGSKVSMVGPVYGQEKFKILSRSLFVAFPSRNEGFSLLSLEALASGLPLVAFDIPSLSWTDKTISLKAKPFDVDDYAHKLKLATNPKIIGPLRDNCREFVKKYTWNNVSDEYESFFKEVLARERTRVVEQLSYLAL